MVERVARLLGGMELAPRSVHLGLQLRQLLLGVALRLHELLVALAHERLAALAAAVDVRPLEVARHLNHVGLLDGVHVE